MWIGYWARPKLINPFSPVDQKQNFYKQSVSVGPDEKAHQDLHHVPFCYPVYQTSLFDIQLTLVISNSKGRSKILKRYLYFDISDLQT